MVCAQGMQLLYSTGAAVWASGQQGRGCTLTTKLKHILYKINMWLHHHLGTHTSVCYRSPVKTHHHHLPNSHNGFIWTSRLLCMHRNNATTSLQQPKASSDSAAWAPLTDRHDHRHTTTATTTTPPPQPCRGSIAIVNHPRPSTRQFPPGPTRRRLSATHRRPITLPPRHPQLPRHLRGHGPGWAARSTCSRRRRCS